LPREPVGALRIDSFTRVWVCALVRLLRLSGFCVITVVLSATVSAAEQESPSGVRTVVDRAPADVAQLKAMQDRVRRVATHLLDCTVAVRVGSAFGSGVLVSSDGYIVTAAHVIGEPGRTAEVRLSDGRRVKGTTLGVNRTSDAGLIKIPSEGKWAFAPMGKSAELKPGQWCLATGHPGGYEQGRGPVLRLGRVLTRQGDHISTDCPLIGGDSGGPLFDLDGNVVAVHSRIADPLTANIHIPVDRFHESWDRLAKGEAWGILPGTTPYVGVRGNRDNDEPVVAGVIPGSPAEKAGVQPGDVVVRFEDRRVRSFQDIVRAVRDHEPGDRVVVEVLRDGSKREITVVVGVRVE
jgi:serine protease Do